MGKSPLLMYVQRVIALCPLPLVLYVVPSLWKSTGRRVEKLKVTQKLRSWVETLENPLPLCPGVSPSSGVVSLILRPAVHLCVCGQESGIYRV